MQEDFDFNRTESQDPEIVKLKGEWLNTLLSPQDGMWEHFRNSAVHWKIAEGHQLLGYACLDDENRLLQFFISPAHLPKGPAALRSFISQKGITKSIVGTNNPIFLSLALELARKVVIDSYLFRQYFDANVAEKAGTLRECSPGDVTRLVDFCHRSTGAPKNWLKSYVTELVKKREMFMLELNEELVGTCEVRKSPTSADLADIGMIVSPDHRRQGYGTYLLHRAKQIAIDWKKKPICSCEKMNTGSLKAIHNIGFVSSFQLLLVELSSRKNL